MSRIKLGYQITVKKYTSNKVPTSADTIDPWSGQLRTPQVSRLILGSVNSRRLRKLINLGSGQLGSGRHLQELLAQVLVVHRLKQVKR
jgi:hypothetical protein